MSRLGRDAVTSTPHPQSDSALVLLQDASPAKEKWILSICRAQLSNQEPGTPWQTRPKARGHLAEHPMPLAGVGSEFTWRWVRCERERPAPTKGHCGIREYRRSAVM
jgi:hypothetical protein